MSRTSKQRKNVLIANNLSGMLCSTLKIVKFTIKGQDSTNVTPVKRHFCAKDICKHQNPKKSEPVTTLQQIYPSDHQLWWWLMAVYIMYIQLVSTSTQQCKICKFAFANFYNSSLTGIRTHAAEISWHKIACTVTGALDHTITWAYIYMRSNKFSVICPILFGSPMKYKKNITVIP